MTALEKNFAMQIALFNSATPMMTVGPLTNGAVIDIRRFDVSIYLKLNNAAAMWVKSVPKAIWQSEEIQGALGQVWSSSPALLKLFLAIAASSAATTGAKIVACNWISNHTGAVVELMPTLPGSGFGFRVAPTVVARHPAPAMLDQLGTGYASLLASGEIGGVPVQLSPQFQKNIERAGTAANKAMNKMIERGWTRR
jgi:hypothetical protein